MSFFDFWAPILLPLSRQKYILFSREGLLKGLLNSLVEIDALDVLASVALTSFVGWLPSRIRPHRPTMGDQSRRLQVYMGLTVYKQDCYLECQGVGSFELVGPFQNPAIHCRAASCYWQEPLFGSYLEVRLIGSSSMCALGFCRAPT